MLWSELDPISLIFTVLMAYWFGGDLCRDRGERHFLLFFFGIAAAAAAGSGVVLALLIGFERGFGAGFCAGLDAGPTYSGASAVRVERDWQKKGRRRG